MKLKMQSDFFIYLILNVFCCYAHHAYNMATFNIKENQDIEEGLHTMKYVSSSKIQCARNCLPTVDCCRAGFTEARGECIVDKSPGCTAAVIQRQGSALMENVIDCETGWEVINGRCVIYSTSWMNYTNSMAYCKQNGGRLVIADTAARNAWLKTVLARFGTYLGARRQINDEFHWEDVDGSHFPFDFTDWSPNEPNNKDGTEGCVEFTFDDKWDDKDCFIRYRPLCEMAWP